MPAYNLTLEQKQMFDNNEFASMWNVTTGADVSVSTITYNSAEYLPCYDAVPSDCTYTVTIGDTFSDDVRIVSSESSGFTASFDTQVLPQEQVVSQAIYEVANEPNDWDLQGVSSCDQCGVSVSGTESSREVVSNEGASDGVSADQEAYSVVEETSRNNSNKVNARFLEEARELEKCWSKTGLLKNLDLDKYGMYGTTCAKFNENQRLINEKVQTGNHWLDK